MTKEELVSKLDTFWADWASQSNATNDDRELLAIGDQAIVDFAKILKDAGGHPDPPPPRIHP